MKIGMAIYYIPLIIELKLPTQQQQKEEKEEGKRPFHRLLRRRGWTISDESF